MHRVSTYVYFAVFLVLAAFFILAAGGAIPNATVDFGTGGKVDINSPWSLAMLMTLIASFTVVINAAIAGRATHQDIDANTTPLLFTRPITRAQYLGGRFLGALGVLLLLSLAIGLGAFVATKLPWMPASRVGPQRLGAYVVPYLLVVVPDLLLMASVFFALAALTRRMLPVYVGAVVALLGYFIGVNLTGDVGAADAGRAGGPLRAPGHRQRDPLLVHRREEHPASWVSRATSCGTVCSGAESPSASSPSPTAASPSRSPVDPRPAPLPRLSPRTAPGWTFRRPGWTSRRARHGGCSARWWGCSSGRR